MGANDLKLPRRAPASTNPKYIRKPGDPSIDQTFDDQFGHELEVPDSYSEPLAAMLLERYRIGKQNRNVERLGKSTVEQTLMQCWQQVEGECDPCLIELQEETGVDLNLNMTLLKVDAFEAWSRKIFLDREVDPWENQPTERPSLSKVGQAAALSSLKQELFLGEGLEGGASMEQIVARIASETLAAEQRYARNASHNMAGLMRDQAQEGGFRFALRDISRDFAIYPYAVLEGPIPTLKRTIEWEGNRLVPKWRLVMAARRVSPFDLFWSPDSPNTQDGSWVIVRERATQKMLLEMAQMKSYIKKNVLAAMQHFCRREISRDWLQRNPERAKGLMWQQHEQIDIIKMYGCFSGRELKPYGLQVDDNEFYEAVVKVLGPYAIQVRVNKNPNPFKRPVHTASMSSNGEKIPGIGFAQKLRDIERGYHSALRALIKNSHFSAGPIGEVDYKRISRWIKEDDLGVVNPYEVTPVDSDDGATGNRPAYNFHQVASQAAPLMQIMDYFERQSDRFTQIPAAFHGEAVGTGVNRTFRGISALQSNALRGMELHLTDLGQGCVYPYACNLRTHNMLYSEDDTVKGDSQVYLRDIGGLLEREVKKQQTIETLTLVAQVAQSGVQLPPGTMQWAVNEALESAGVDMERFSAMEAKQGVPTPGAAAAGDIQTAPDPTLAASPGQTPDPGGAI